MTIQQMLDSGEVDQELETPVLEEARASVDQLIKALRQSNWGPVGELTLKRYEGLEAQLLAVLNQRHGVDGMTPLTG